MRGACVRVCLCARSRLLAGVGSPQKAVFSPGNAVFARQEDLPAGKLGLGELGVGGRGEACSPAAQAFVEAGLLLSPGSPCWLSPLCGARHPVMGPRGGGNAGGSCRDGGTGAPQTLGLGLIPAGSLGSGVSEEGGPGRELPFSCVCPFPGETPPHEGRVDGTVSRGPARGAGL